MDWKVDGLVVAIDEEGGIGKDGRLPWPHMAEDMKRFHQITCEVDEKARSEGSSNVLVMGRKTFDSLPNGARPLKGRISVVVTSDASSKLDNAWDGRNLQDVYFVPSYEDALSLCGVLREKRWGAKVFGIGGSSCYRALAEHADTIYLTKVTGRYECDVFFEYDESEFADCLTVTPTRQHFCEFKVLLRKTRASKIIK